MTHTSAVVAVVAVVKIIVAAALASGRVVGGLSDLFDEDLQGDGVARHEPPAQLRRSHAARRVEKRAGVRVRHLEVVCHVRRGGAGDDGPGHAALDSVLGNQERLLVSSCAAVVNVDPDCHSLPRVCDKGNGGHQRIERSVWIKTCKWRPRGPRNYLVCHCTRRIADHTTRCFFHDGAPSSSPPSSSSAGGRPGPPVPTL